MDKEEALNNLAKYESLPHLKHIMGNIFEMKKLAEGGNQTALCIVMDLEKAIYHPTILTEKQQKVVIMKYLGKETNDYIAEQMNISETAIRKHLQGALKRIQRFLVN